MDKLGKRLAASGRIDANDRALFGNVLDYYETVLESTCAVLYENGFSPTSRVKTTTTLAEKLAREHGIQLSRINDIAGARIVVRGGRVAQDRAFEKIVELFEAPGLRPPHVIDRRDDPRQGYRAVHVIVYPQATPVEIQVRTELQDIWAQIFERFADQWGRAVRYGGDIEAAELDRWPVDFRDDVSKALRGALDLLTAASHAIDGIETLRAHAERTQEAIATLRRPATRADPADDREREALMSEYLPLRLKAKRMLEMYEPDRRKRGRVIRRYLRRDDPTISKFHAAVKLILGPAAETATAQIRTAGEGEKVLRYSLEMFSRIIEPLQRGVVS